MVFPGNAAVNTALNAHVTAAMWGLVAPTMFVESVDVIDLDGISASSNFATGGGAKWTGGGTGDPIPQGASVIKLTTTLRGRSHRGRVYLPAVPEGDQANGVLTGSVVATVQTAWVAFAAAMAADATTPLAFVVASYKLATQTAISTISAEGKMATQRRRMTRLR
jgi:hypothetical protein